MYCNHQMPAMNGCRHPNNPLTMSDLTYTLSEATDSPQTTARSLLVRGSIVLLLASLFVVDSAAAQSTADAFCNTSFVATAQNIFIVLLLSGPLIGGVIFLGSTVALPVIRRADRKQELKEARTQGLLWGVIVAPIGTAILGFILNNVVVGASSCGF